MVGLLSILQCIYGKAVAKAAQVQGDAQEDAAEMAESATMQTVTIGEEEYRRCQQILENNQSLLVLVNKENALDTNYDARLKTICNGRLQASQWMYEDLCAMLEAAGEEGYDYWIASAYRSRQRQQELIDDDVAERMEQGKSYDEALAETLMETMPAGYSEHETGLALDILCSGNMNMDESQAAEPGNQWLARHCQEYGFILRYPADKVSETEIDYEPWHFRYVGKEAAQYITENELTLEEFWERTKGEQQWN
jgi:D-alanyl-D-alanine carboxypeptidase